MGFAFQLRVYTRVLTLYPVALPCSFSHVPCALCPVPCALYFVPCALYVVLCTSLPNYTRSSRPYPVPCTLYHCALYLVPLVARYTRSSRLLLLPLKADALGLTIAQVGFEVGSRK